MEKLRRGDFDELHYAYSMGRDCGLKGPNETNCHFSIFSRREFTDEWERGKIKGESDRRLSWIMWLWKV